MTVAEIVVHQLHRPTDVLVDKEGRRLIVCDRRNRRVTRWLHQYDTWRGETVINDIACYGLATDHEGYLYVTDTDNHLVRRYRRGETSGIVVAGGNGKGVGLDQLNNPHYVFVDGDQAVYVSDSENHRVMKWLKGAGQGKLVAGENGWMQLPSLIGFPLNR